MTTLSNQAAELLPILQSLPMEEKMQIIHALSNNETAQPEKSEKPSLTVAEFVTAMEKFDFPKGKTVTIEDMDKGIAKMFENWEG